MTTPRTCSTARTTVIRTVRSASLRRSARTTRACLRRGGKTSTWSAWWGAVWPEPHPALASHTADVFRHQSDRADLLSDHPPAVRDQPRRGPPPSPVDRRRLRGGDRVGGIRPREHPA